MRQINTINKPKGSFRTGVVLIVTLLTPFTSTADSFGDFQLRRLLEPTERQYLAELGGKIYIYDGIEANQVDVAMDNHFDRIDSMMFTRIIQTNEDGEEYVEDDGCD